MAGPVSAAPKDEHADVWAIKDKVRRLFTFKHRVLVSATTEISTSGRWHQLRKRLEVALDKGFTSTIAIDLNLAGRRRSDLHPTVILTCTSAADEQKLITLLQSWTWLRDYQFWFWVVTVKDLSLLAPVHARVEQSELNGLAARGEYHDMTVGGVVWLDKKPYALTVGHAFREADPIVKESTESQPTTTTTHAPDHPFRIGELARVLNARPLPRIVRHAADTPLEVIPDLASSRRQTSANSVLGNSSFNSWPSTPNRTFDWGLIEIADNVYPTEITTVANESGFISGEVTVIASSGTQPGYINSRRSLLRFGSAHMAVRQITLERPLQVGDSGAWVLCDGKLCGHIVAGYATVPWAYMMPMHRVFSDIQKKLHKTASLTPPVGFFKSLKGALEKRR